MFVGANNVAIPFARTRDLSLTGLRLETDASLKPGLVLEISIAWGTDVVSCQASVVRSTEDGVAISFLDPDTFFLQALQEIMDSTPLLEPLRTPP